MTEQRAPYFANDPLELARQIGQTASSLHQEIEAELRQARQRIALLEEAAREVCRLADDDRSIPRSQAVRDLASLIHYPSWWQL